MRSFYQFVQQFKNFKDRPALWTSDESIKLSYSELYTQIVTFANFLSEIIVPGDRVVFTDLSGPQWVVAFFAIVLNHGIAVPIDQRIPVATQIKMAKSVGAKFYLSSKVRRDLKLKRIEFRTHTAVKKTDFIEKKIKSDTIAEIIFTSGTWGLPKGVVLTHKNLLSNLNSILDTYHIDNQERLLSILPLAHAYEQMCGLFVPLSLGCQIIYQTKLDSFSLVQALQKYQIHSIVLVPKVLELFKAKILSKAGSKKPLLQGLLFVAQLLPFEFRRSLFPSVHTQLGKSLHTLAVGGAPLDDQTRSFFLNLGYQIVLGYGLSEASPSINHVYRKTERISFGGSRNSRN